MALFSRQSNGHDKTATFDPATRRRLKREQKERDKHFFVRDNDLRDIAPHNGYKFFSNYFTYGKRFGRLLTLVEDDQADRALTPFWKILLIPQSSTLNDKAGETSPNAVFGAHGQLFDMLENKPKSWASDKQVKADTSVKMEGSTADGAESAHKVGQRKTDNNIIAADRAAGDMYGSTEYKVLITARSLADLDTAVFRYEQWISTHFDGIHFEVYEGQQKVDMHNLLRTADVQLGNHPMATSSEYAGGYEILTRGVTDPNGDYIGQMVGDVNNTAVLMDLDNYDGRVVLAHSAQPTMLGAGPEEFEKGTRATTLLGVRLAQAALINNHRVVHLVLNGARPQDLGADLSDITTVVSLNGGKHEGAINPFELFGDPAKRRSQYSKFPTHTQKLRLMIKQLSPSVDDVDLNEVFTNIIKDFYKDEEMLVDNPKENWQKLRLIGLPHNQYPKLAKFVAYLNQAMDSAASHGNQLLVSRIERVRSAFNVMLQDNQDLFDVVTNDDVDSANQSPQVVYDFSSLRRRGAGIAMAQFINAIRYATDTLDDRDVVILHGVDNLSDSVKDYVSDVFDELGQRNVRLVFLYDDPAKCLDDVKFNKLDFADWTMLGGFNKPVINQYQELIQQALPGGLQKAILDYGGSQYGDSIYYLSRGIDNVLFALDMNMGTRHGDYLSEHPRGTGDSSASK